MSMLAAISTNTDGTPVTRKDLGKQLKTIYERISRHYPFLSCIGIAAKGIKDQELVLYPTSCDDINGKQLPKAFEQGTGGNTHVLVEDLTAFSTRNDSQTQQSLFQSGLRLPLIANDVAFGYTFFAATEKGCFTPDIIEQMNVYARVIARIVTEGRRSSENLRTAVASVLQLNNINKSESPAHLRRVAHYSRLIARNCAQTHQLSDSWIEHLFMFAPLHDIGKAFIPERLLTKPGRLTDEEFEQVKTHTLKGRDIIDHMISCFGYSDDLHYTGMLRNIITHHHEAMDGGGYPYGLRGEEIPLEARIVAAADVLDALLTKRAYKEAWSMDKTMETLQQLADSRLDPEFVDILSQNREEVLQIRIRCAKG
ncbi:HD-GYP domain-containing protein [Thiolapillus brandeum]|uniref:HD-GYP domain-containing protein n=1 Tax=Thiolapillus brandeum TaxID=1076588 RepID=A0A7U6JIW8_9GAMM|nr:HD domain-containing phosphohydrolase [Thiolapillus brandeum]BAO45711.1 conserved hypothetical protein [Thiolapillus brandeum]